MPLKLESFQELRDHPIVAASLGQEMPAEAILEQILAEELPRRDLRRKRPLAPADHIEPADPRRAHGVPMSDYVLQLARDGTIIEIPHYRGMRAPSPKPGEYVVSREHRHGPLLGLVSNLETHSFSLWIEDHNVVRVLPDGTQIPHAPRRFAVVFDDGNWWEGSATFRYFANASMDEYLRTHELPPADEIEFPFFVNPQLYSANYTPLTAAEKIAFERVSAEARFYRKVASWLANLVAEEQKLKPPKQPAVKAAPERAAPMPVVPSYPAPGIMIPEDVKLERSDIEVLEVRVWVPEFSRKLKIRYPICDESENVYEPVARTLRRLPLETKKSIVRHSRKRANTLSYTIGPQISLFFRLKEYALFMHGFRGGIRLPGHEKNPGWETPKWNRRYTHPDYPETSWNGALALSWTPSGKPDIVWAYRTRETPGYRRVFA